MTWEARTTSPIRADLISSDRLALVVNELDTPGLSPDQSEHRDAAIAAASLLAAALGSKSVEVAIAGNATPGHEPRPDLPGERITVTVWASREDV
jgi:hypothetical protein